MEPTALDTAHKTSEVILAIGAFASIIATQIVTTKLNSMKIEALTACVAKQNGKIGRTLARMRKLEIRCAGLHGVAAADLELEDEEEEGEDG